MRLTRREKSVLGVLQSSDRARVGRMDDGWWILSPDYEAKLPLNFISRMQDRGLINHPRDARGCTQWGEYRITNEGRAAIAPPAPTRGR